MSIGRRKQALLSMGLVFVALFASALWLTGKGITIKDNLAAVQSALPALKDQILKGSAANPETVEGIKADATRAKKAANDPLWRAASALPGIGANFSAVTETGVSLSDVVDHAVVPLASDQGVMDITSLSFSDGRIDVGPLKEGAPKVVAAANVLRLAHTKLSAIDASKLLPDVARPLVAARDELAPVASALDASASALELIPAMLGSDAERKYLLMIQNNAEARASGGIPGALAVFALNEGKISLESQSSAGEVGVTMPSVTLDQETQIIYSSRAGKFMQDVNLTPDFPTAAASAQAMWERKTGQPVDGVLSIDPVALSYVLRVTGPVAIQGVDPELIDVLGLPTVLTADNLVQTLLSDVYAKIDQPEAQDLYFAAVARNIFTALSAGGHSAKDLVTGINRGAEEGRILVWSASSREQSILFRYPVSGSMTGPSVSPAQFGVYFNDGTGAKMDYYVRRTAQLVKECPQDGYEQTTVRITSTNTAPLDAATSLPSYVTGNGKYGVPIGSVQTNVTVYGPVQAVVETAQIDGQKTGFAPYIHSTRPVGMLTVQLAPGETKTVEFTFGRIVQHTEPNLVVTPTIQPVKDVTLPTEKATCR